jgi:hypothetical protein
VFRSVLINEQEREDHMRFSDARSVWMEHALIID